METLTRIFGQVVPTFFTTTGGVSMSEVARIQAENKQQNDKFWSVISDAVSSVFRKVLTFLGNAEASRTISGSTVAVDDIRNQYSSVAGRNAQTAVLMHGLKLLRRMETTLERMDLDHLIADIPEAPVHVSSAKKGTTCDTSTFMEMTNIDDMIAHLHDAILVQFDFGFFRRANELNSKAAAIGKLLSEQGSFFRELLRPLPKGSEQATQTGVIVTQWEREYSPADLESFALLRDELRQEYENLQRQLNGCRKQIKDAVRAYNLDEERAYQTRYGAYRIEADRYDRACEQIRSAAETLRQQALGELAGLRVRVEV